MMRKLNIPRRSTGGANWFFLGFLAIAGYFLLSEHRAHVVPYLPFLLLLACPLMHMFMHGGHGHGGHGDDDKRGEHEHGGHGGHGGCCGGGDKAEQGPGETARHEHGPDDKQPKRPA
ncbi:MAG: DUF2933 domain-containing protein [Gammaproteobacteria bacterium]|nr:DUF2933 domain-containing protein [Gammaproteobacteria bacterium]